MSFLVLVWPEMMRISSLGQLNFFARKRINSVLALPRSGGAAIRIFKVPSAISSINSVLGDLGVTLTCM